MGFRLQPFDAGRVPARDRSVAAHHRVTQGVTIRKLKVKNNYYPYAHLLSHLEHALSTIPLSKASHAELVEVPSVGFLCEMDRFVRAVQKEEATPYVLQGRNFKARKLPFSDAQDVGNWDWHFASVRAWGHAHVPYLLVAPHLELLMEVYRHHRISEGMFKGPNAPFFGGERNAEVFNDFCLELRRTIAAKKKLRQECLTWALGSKQNLLRLHRYLDALSHASPVMKAYHFTFFHTTEPLNLSKADEKAHLAYLKPLRACRSVFINGFARKTSLFPSKPGYVWSLEPSLSGGWGLRFTLLWPGETIRPGGDQMDHAREIGNYWVSQATKSNGSYLLHGIDQVSCFDTATREESVTPTQLKKRLQPLAVRDALFRFVNEPEGKYFGIGHSISRGAKLVDPHVAQDR